MEEKSTLPSRFRPEAVTRYRPFFKEVARNYPNVVIIDPAPIACDTFSCRFRDAVRAVLEYGSGEDMRETVEVFARNYSVASVRGTAQLVIGSKESIKAFNKIDNSIGSVVDANLAVMDVVESPSEAVIKALFTLIQAGVLEHATLTGATMEQVQRLSPATGRPVEIMDHEGTITLL
jgi:hypothetical protein